ncbi:MAG: hypothetical protein Q9183_007273 [Haloplaca sp. 2 TL-2023]
MQGWKPPEREIPALEVTKRSKPRESMIATLDTLASMRDKVRKIQQKCDEGWESASSDEAPGTTTTTKPQRDTRGPNATVAVTGHAPPTPQEPGTHQPSRYRIPQRHSEPALRETQQPQQRETGSRYAPARLEDVSNKAKNPDAKKQGAKNQNVDNPVKQASDIPEKKGEDTPPKEGTGEKKTEKKGFLARWFWG